MSGHAPQPVVGSRLHHAISIAVISTLSIGGFEALAYMNNLYQPTRYINLALEVYFFLLAWLVFIFDLHFRDRSTPLREAESIGRAIAARFGHLVVWQNIRHLYNAAILPSIIFWGTVILVGINFGHVQLQQILIAASSVALVSCYTLFKEIFRTRELPVSNTRFLVLYYAKLYGSWLAYSASLGIVWYYCFPAGAFYAMAFGVTFILKYQALYQYGVLTPRNVAWALIGAVLMCIASYFIYIYWNVNYFTAGLLMTAFYNLMWGIFFHSVNKNFTKENILENFAIFILMVVLVFGTTNFAERIARCT